METQKQIGVGIIGGSGYGAGELLRLLAYHPEVEVLSVVSRSHVGKPITDLHPHLASFYNLCCDAELNLQALSKYKYSVVFSALPHGVSAKTISKLAVEVPEIRIIDLSGDFRLIDKNQHEQFYPDSPFCPEIRSKFCYGLPEVVGLEKISNSRLIANPGCYATACILAIAPLINHFQASVFFDAKSGTSGAGRALSETTHHPLMHSNFSAYKVLQHRHEPEIQQVIGQDLKCSFVPHLIPVTRGIFVTAHLELSQAVEEKTILSLYHEFYAGKHFIRLRQPQLEAVATSNFCDIAVACRGNRIVAMSALDNLVKGMAGQAIQNMNLMCGLTDTTGLLFPAAGLI